MCTAEEFLQYHLGVHENIDIVFRKHWIRRKDVNEWSAGFLDLTPLDYFMELLKTMHVNRPQSIQKL